MISEHVGRKPPRERLAFRKSDKPYPILLFKNQETNPILISSNKKPYPTFAVFGIPWVFSVKSLLVYTVYKYFYVYYVCKGSRCGPLMISQHVDRKPTWGGWLSASSISHIQFYCLKTRKPTPFSLLVIENHTQPLPGLASRGFSL